VPLHLGKELFDFIRNREAKKQAVAVAVQPEVWGEAQLRAPGKGAGDDRSGVMGCVVEAKAVAITETVVRFSAPPAKLWRQEVQGFAGEAEAKMRLPPTA
jgi:hypothetical protein